MTQLPEPIDVSVRYEWDVFGCGAPLAEQKLSTARVTTRIRPRKLVISRTPWRGGLHVYIQGIVVKKDGNEGEHIRAVSYDDAPIGLAPDDPARSIAEMPSWVRPYLEQARAWEAKR